jgi:hypothetical protein
MSCGILPRMGWIQLTNDILGHVFSWPVFGVVAVVVLRRQIAALLGRITSYEGLGQKLNFGRGVAKIEEGIEELPEQAGSSNSSDGQSVITLQDERYRLARDFPAAAVTQGFRDIEIRMRQLWSHYSPEQKKKPSFSQLVMSLADGRIIPGSLAGIILKLRELYNTVAHEGAEPTTGEAVAYIESTQKIAEILDNLIGFANSGIS